MARVPAFHRFRLALVVAIAGALILLSLSAGSPKPWGRIDWLDVVGEGGTTLIALAWIYLVLASRPRGRVTSLIYAGGLAYFVSTWLDLLDEFVAYAADLRWMAWLESIPAPLGMVLLTFGLVGWHREQRTINLQLKRRERFYREHRMVDYLTKLYSADYLVVLLQRELRLHQVRQAPLTLLLIDLNDFAGYNQRHGDAAGDRLLRDVSECLLAQIRQDDLLCRYAGDRFVLLLPNSSNAEGNALGQHLGQQVQQLYPIGRQITATVVAITADNDSAASLLQRGQRALVEAKSRRPWQRQRRVG